MRKEYVDNVLLQYITEKRQSLGLAIDHPALELFDNFKAQCTPAILTQLDQNNINVVLVPPNCTDWLHPLDISVNKAIKNQLRAEFQSWYARQVLQQRQEGQQKIIDLKMSTVKPAWIESACNYVCQTQARNHYQRF